MSYPQGTRFLFLFSMLTAFPSATPESDEAKPDSVLEPFYMHRNVDTLPFDSPREDTLRLPDKTASPGDSLGREFKKYWTKVEKEDGFDKLRAQLHARDIDKSWFPHWYLFDSNLVVFPGWIVIRKKNRK